MANAKLILFAMLPDITQNFHQQTDFIIEYSYSRNQFTQYTWQSLNEIQRTWLYGQSVKSCADAISRASFLELF